MTTATVLSAGVSAADLLCADFAQEHTSTRRMLAHYPEGTGDWRPHEKSRSLAQLATHVADIVNHGTRILTTDGFDVLGRQPVPLIDSASALVAHFDAALASFNALFPSATLADLERPWSIRRADQVLVAAPKRIMLRTMMMSHLSHHRAQLGVYYRLLGVAVPGMYGPSADD